MRSWLHHPRYIPVRDALITKFVERVYYFERLKTVIFLCGGADSVCRDRVAEYLRKKNDVLVFYADHVWNEIAQQNLNALAMEDQLAKLADAVIIIVESPGTFCELGAFSLHDSLRKKLLPLVDIQYRDHPSFINTGPIAWVNKESVFAPSIYADTRVVLEAAAEIDKRVNRVRFTFARPVTRLADEPKYLLFLLCDLVAIVGPIQFSDTQYFCDHISAGVGQSQLASLLGLAVSLDLVRKKDVDGVSFFYSELENDKLHNFRRKELFEPAVERAQFMSVLLQIEDAVSVLRAIGQ